MNEARDLAEFMYLEYSQVLHDRGIRVPQFKKLSTDHQAAWISSATMAIVFVSTRKLTTPL